MSVNHIDSEKLGTLSEALLKEMPKESGPVAVLAPNGLSALVARQIANLRKTPLVPINPLLRPAEVEHILADSGAKSILCAPSMVATAKAALNSIPATSSKAQLIPTGFAEMSDDDVLLFEGGKTALRAQESEIGATLIYTSGTTGKPKGCYRSAAQECARANELISTYSITSEDVQLIACPLAHSAPGIFVRAAHAVGARSVILPRFSVPHFYRRWREYQASLFFLVPTQYRRLLASEEPVPEVFRAAIVAGAPLAASLHARMEAWLGANRLWQFYGSSETGTISIAPPGCLVSSGVGGLAPGVEVEIRDVDGERCSGTEIGEMFVRSPTVMSGYWPRKCLESGSGFVSVGDLGHWDAEGNLHLVDRKNDTIISGGVNVYPAEVEAALVAIDGVEAAVVIGVQSADWGQKVVALVAKSKNFSSEELRGICKQRIASYKVPKEFYWVPLGEMPVGASGKAHRLRAKTMVRQLAPAE